jgi:hypothetical protein
MIDKREGRPGVAYKSASNCRLARSSRGFSGDTQHPYGDCEHRIWSGFPERFASRTALSSANGLRGQHDAGEKTASRIADNVDQSARFSFAAAIGIYAGKTRSTISQLLDLAEKHRRRSHSVSVVFPFRKLTQDAEEL